MNKTKTIAVIGGGAWGSALASTLARLGHRVRIWVRGESHADALARGRSPMLDMPMHPPDLASTDSGAVLDGVDAVLAVLPAAATDSTIALLGGRVAATVPIAWAAKGLVPKGDSLIVEAVTQLPNPAVMLGGPSFAAEVMHGLPAALVAASSDEDSARFIASLFENNALRAYSPLRLYSNLDPIGVAVGGAVKNVIAIACGAVAGMGLGENARSAVITRGLAEATRFAVALGGKPETLAGLAGLGDMALTCTSPQSRNFAFGVSLATEEGSPPTQLVEGQLAEGQLAEGRYSAQKIIRRTDALGVDMPITKAVQSVLDNRSTIGDAIATLLHRPITSE